jgi:hypothetical protein
MMSTERARRPRPWLFVVMLGVAAFGIGALASCGSGEDERSVSDPGPEHVHALGLNPGDRSLFIATHNGLYRLPPDAQRAERVGDRYQDTMGFTVVGRDHFLGSGHPELLAVDADVLYAATHEGEIKHSVDGGTSWRSVGHA